MSLFAAIPEDAPSAHNRGSDFWLHDGVLYGKTRRSAPHGELSDAVDAISRIRDLIGGVPRPLVFDARHVGWLQITAREHVHKHAEELFTRAAVVVGPRSKRLLEIALFRRVRVRIPVELFTNEADAWRFAVQQPNEKAS